MKPWECLEQATIWIKGAMRDMDSSGRPCRHCVQGAKDWLDNALQDQEEWAKHRPSCPMHLGESPCRCGKQEAMP